MFATPGYDGIKGGKKRRAPIYRTRHEDRILKSSDRRSSTATLRDLHRNFAIVAWACRKHLDYVSQFDFQSRVGTNQDDQIETLMAQWQRPLNCDVTGRHNFAKIVRMMELRRVVDNDVGLLMLRNGSIQTIEGDRIDDPDNVKLFEGQGLRWFNGVGVNQVGRPVLYGLHNRMETGGRTFARTLRAQNFILHGFFDRFDQYRGISPLNAAINSFQDVYEGVDLALAKMKVEQLFALVFTRDAEESLGQVSGEDEDGDGVNDSYSVDFGKGPVQLDLDPGDAAEFLKSDNPGSNTQEFLHAVLGIAIKALDLPFNMYDESHTNFFGSRAAWLLYDRSCTAKRGDLLEVLRRVTLWKYRQWIRDGRLTLAPGQTLEDLPFEWVPRGMPWWDPTKEIAGNLMAIEGGLDNPQRVCKSTGTDFYENIDRTAEAIAYAKEKGVPLKFAMMPEPEETDDGEDDSDGSDPDSD